MMFGQLIEYRNRNIFIRNYAGNEAGELLVPVRFLFFRKSLY